MLAMINSLVACSPEIDGGTFDGSTTVPKDVDRGHPDGSSVPKGATLSEHQLSELCAVKARWRGWKGPP